MQVLLCCLLPPLAVWNKGAGNIILVIILTVLGWIPGAIAALVICNNDATVRKIKKEINKQNYPRY
jgi:uncharacterized membrane protein YqaE (UPF0057 family)